MTLQRNLTSETGFVHRFEPGTSETTVLLLHGTGADENDLIGLGRELAPDAALLSPRGKVLEHGMPRFFKRLGMGVFDIEDLEKRTEELAGFIASAAQTYGFDPSKVVAVGYSNGANIAASLLLRHPQVLRYAVLLRVMVPYEIDPLPDLSHASVLVTAGRDDPMIPAHQAASAADLLERCGAEARLAWQPGGHELTGAELEIVREWLIEKGLSPAESA